MLHNLWLHGVVVAFLVVLALRSRRFTLLGLAFAASWLGDLLSRFVFGGGFEAFYWWVPVQIGLAFLAVEQDYRRRVTGVGVLIALVPVSVAMSYPAPEVLVMAVGSCAVCLLAKGSLRWPVYLYFGGGSALHLGMAARMMTGDPLWNWYQGVRLAAFVVFVALAVRSQDVGISACDGRRLRDRRDATPQ